MPAPADMRPRERLIALAAVVLVQGGLILGLLSGFRVDVARTRDSVERLIDITLATPPPPPPRVHIPPPKAAPREHHAQAAPKAQPAPLGGSPGPQPAQALPAPAPIVAVRPSAPASGGGTGSGPAVGSRSGGASGGSGDSADDGGTESVQIAGEITPSDYPKSLGRSGIGGHVGIDFTVGTTGRVSRCRVTRSSGVPQLDDLTCRLIVERFRFRPATDSAGRPVEDEIEGVHVWSVTGGY